MFVRHFENHPELGIAPISVDATPLPQDLRRFGDTSLRFLRRWGLDFHATRWRLAASRHICRQLLSLHREAGFDAIVANTQSIALSLSRWPDAPPLIIGLDATFQQLAASEWFAPNTVAMAVSPVTLHYLKRRERELFKRTDLFLPWSQHVASSLHRTYGVSNEKLLQLPPSVCNPTNGSQERTNQDGRRQILFLGGDFRRKGGDLLLAAFQRLPAESYELHVVTQSPVAERPGVHVHREVSAGSERWRRRWTEASIFVFPSRLETFGIVLLEALAFGVPVISSRAGAAEEILENGAAGILLDENRPEAVYQAILQIDADPSAAQRRVERGRQIVAEKYNLPLNSRRLSDAIYECIRRRESFRP